jgi:hypothetical protein
LTLEELQKLYSDLSDPEWKPDFDFNIRLNQAAGFETTRNGRGWCRRTPGESRWRAMSRPVTDPTDALRLLVETLPQHRLILDVDPTGETQAELCGPGEWAEPQEGRDPCHAIALALVA